MDNTFNISYHGKAYKQIAGGVFNAGIIPAIEYANQNTEGEICLTDRVYVDYIYVLYTQKIRPSEYIDQIEWAYEDDPTAFALIPRRIGKFAFIGYSCANTQTTAYILSLKENPPPGNTLGYKEKRFLKFKVLIPRQ